MQTLDELQKVLSDARALPSVQAQLKASRDREWQLEQRVSALSKGPTMIPGMANDPYLDKVAALKELCDKKDKELGELHAAYASAEHQRETELEERDNNREISALKDAQAEAGKANKEYRELAEVLEKTRAALTLAEQRASKLEAVNLGEEYHKARANDLQKRLSAMDASRNEDVRKEREYIAKYAYGCEHYQLSDTLLARIARKTPPGAP